MELVSGLIEELAKLVLVGELDLGKPSAVGGRLVKERGLVAERLVNLLNDTRDGRVNVRSGLDRLDGAD